MGANVTRIGFIGFGEAARAWCTSLPRDGTVRISAYDILLETEARQGFEVAAKALGVTLAEGSHQAIRDADIVVSAVTAAQSLIAAQSVAGAVRPGQVYLDINSVSPGRKRDTAALISDTGAAYVDMAVMAPVHPKGHRTPVLIAGADVPALQDFLDGFGFDHDRVGPEPGAATTIKMIRSLFVKGLEALTVQALTAADSAGVYDRIFASLSGSYPGLNWDKFPGYQFERVATHGIRRAAEMRESAATLREMGFAEGGDLAAAVAELHQAVGQAGLALQGVPAADCAGLLARALRSRGKP